MKDLRTGFVIAEGGKLVKLVCSGGSPPCPGHRGVIRGFSSASRRRLLHEVHSIDESQADPYRLFITLTYPAEYPDDNRQWQRHLELFRKRLTRRQRVQYALAKLEPQRRGAPHWHIILFTDEPLPHGWVAEAWYDIVDSGDINHLAAGTQVKVIRDFQGVRMYVSKYIAKTIDADGLPACWQGIRFWRRWGTTPATLVEGDLPLSTWWRARRMVNRAQHSLGYLGKRRYNKGLSAFLSSDSGFRILEQAHRITRLVEECGREVLTDPGYNVTTSAHGSPRRFIPDHRRADC